MFQMEIQALWVAIFLSWVIGVSSLSWEFRKLTWVFLNFIIIEGSFTYDPGAHQASQKMEIPKSVKGFLNVNEPEIRNRGRLMVRKSRIGLFLFIAFLFVLDGLFGTSRTCCNHRSYIDSYSHTYIYTYTYSEATATETITPVPPPIPVFPGAEGFGTMTIGGRGGESDRGDQSERLWSGIFTSRYQHSKGSGLLSFVWLAQLNSNRVW